MAANNKGVGHWKKRKAIAMYLNRRQRRASDFQDTSIAYKITTELSDILMTESGDDLTTEVV